MANMAVDVDVAPVSAPENPSQYKKTIHLNGDGIAGHDDPETILLNAVEQSPTMAEFRLSNASHTIKESRTLLKFTPQNLPNQMVRSALSGPDRIACDPFVLSSDETGAVVTAYYLGPKVAGHTGLAHGGLLMTLLDECMGRACFPVLAGKIAVTAQIDISFKRPVPTESVIFVKAWTEKVEGRKAWVKASIVHSSDEGQSCAEASALFIEPRNAVELDILI